MTEKRVQTNQVYSSTTAATAYSSEYAGVVKTVPLTADWVKKDVVEYTIDGIYSGNVIHVVGDARKQLGKGQTVTVLGATGAGNNGYKTVVSAAYKKASNRTWVTVSQTMTISESSSGVCFLSQSSWTNATVIMTIPCDNNVTRTVNISAGGLVSINASVQLMFQKATSTPARVFLLRYASDSPAADDPNSYQKYLYPSTWEILAHVGVGGSGVGNPDYPVADLHWDGHIEESAYYAFAIAVGAPSGTKLKTNQTGYLDVIYPNIKNTNLGINTIIALGPAGEQRNPHCCAKMSAVIFP